MSTASLKHFSIFFDRYYWQTAVLIAKNGLARQYRNSFLGMLWTLFQPLTMVFIYALIMPMIMKTRIPNYPLYMVMSLPLWNYFSTSLYAASQSIVVNGETLKRCMVSSTVFAVADLLRYTYVFITSFGTMFAVALLFFAPLHWTMLLIPFFFIPVLMIMGSVCIAVAFLAPYIRDIGDLIIVAMNMFFWLTPVIYPVDILPPWAQDLMQWNPFFIMMRPLQMLGYDHVVPGMPEILHLAFLTLIAICVGFGIYSTCRRNYVYYL